MQHTDRFIRKTLFPICIELFLLAGLSTFAFFASVNAEGGVNRSMFTAIFGNLTALTSHVATSYYAMVMSLRKLEEVL